jgi:hypothetical protein
LSEDAPGSASAPLRGRVLLWTILFLRCCIATPGVPAVAGRSQVVAFRSSDRCTASAIAGIFVALSLPEGVRTNLHSYPVTASVCCFYGEKLHSFGMLRTLSVNNLFLPDPKISEVSVNSSFSHRIGFQHKHSCVCVFLFLPEGWWLLSELRLKRMLHNFIRRIRLALSCSCELFQPLLIF